MVTARDEEYLPLDNASVELVISPVQGEPFVLKAEMDDNEAGKYVATYWSREPGGIFSHRQCDCRWTGCPWGWRRQDGLLMQERQNLMI